MENKDLCNRRDSGPQWKRHGIYSLFLYREHLWSYPESFEFLFGFYSLPFEDGEPPQLVEIYSMSV